MRWRADSVNRTAVLVEGDGAYLSFPDKTFDAAFAAFVVSAAPDAVALLGDMQRVCRPGARIVIVNHFSPNEPRLARLRSGFSTVTSRLLGFHAEFPLEPLFKKAGIEVDRIESATFCWGWRVVTFTRREL